jgi:hypothetical protein
MWKSIGLFSGAIEIRMSAGSTNRGRRVWRPLGAHGKRRAHPAVARSWHRSDSNGEPVVLVPVGGGLRP